MTAARPFVLVFAVAVGIALAAALPLLRSLRGEDCATLASALETKLLRTQRASFGAQPPEDIEPAMRGLATAQAAFGEMAHEMPIQRTSEMRAVVGEISERALELGAALSAMRTSIAEARPDVATASARVHDARGGLRQMISKAELLCRP